MGNDREKALRQCWRTPRGLFDVLHEEFRFAIDAAASESNALLPRFWTEEDDSLSRSWGGERVFCNPPFRKAGVFVQQAYEQVLGGGCPLAVVLCKVSTNSKWFYRYGRHSEVCFFHPRLEFTPDPALVEMLALRGARRNTADFDSNLLVFRPDTLGRSPMFRIVSPKGAILAGPAW